MWLKKKEKENKRECGRAPFGSSTFKSATADAKDSLWYGEKLGGKDCKGKTY